MQNTALAPVPVPGTDQPIMALEHEGKPVVSLRHACEAIGIDHSPQARKLKNKSWASVVLMTTQVLGDAADACGVAPRYVHELVAA